MLYKLVRRNLAKKMTAPLLAGDFFDLLLCRMMKIIHSRSNLEIWKAKRDLLSFGCQMNDVCIFYVDIMKRQ